MAQVRRLLAYRQREWDTFIREARSRWQTLRDQIDRLRRTHPPPPGDEK